MIALNGKDNPCAIRVVDAVGTLGAAERLLKALNGLHQQTWPASRLVVSVDGQLSTELTEVLHRAPLPVHILQSASWQGTGAPLAAGLLECRCK